MSIAVTWIQGVLRVATGSSGSPRLFVDSNAAWSREQFPDALAEALAKARAPRGEVFLGTDSAMVLPLLEEVPPATAAITAKLLQRRAEKAAVFTEPVFFGSTVLPGVVGAGLRRYLLQVAPAAWVEAIDKALGPRGYQLSGLFPAALALQPVLEKLPVPRDEAVLLAAEAEAGLLQVVGRSDGAILFYRTLPAAETRGPEEVLRELRRLALYGEQRLGLKVRKVFFSGESALRLMAAAEGAEDLAAAAGPSLGTNTYLRALFQAKARLPDNLVPRRIAMRTQVRRWKFLAAAGSVGLLVLAVLYSAGRLVEREIKAAEIRKIWQQQDELAAQANRERDGLVRFGRQMELARILREETGRPVPELILRSLPEILPAGLELTSVRVELSPQRSVGPSSAPVYRIELAGRTAKEDQPVLQAVGQLCEALEKSEWRARILGGTGRENATTPVPQEQRAPGRFYLAAEVE